MNWLQKISRLIDSPKLQAITEKWEAAIPGIVLFVYEQENRVVLSSLIIPKNMRQQGLGSQIMQELTAYADSVGKRIELSPGTRDAYNGTTSRGRLVRFYKNFGFRENKGRHKDYRTSETMFREPTKQVSANKINWLQKTADLNGEWFLDEDGNSTYADGDIGDLNHEAYALQCKIPDELWERYDQGKLTKRQRKEIGEDFLQYMEHGGEARDWMVEKEGWIRVHGDNFELYELTEAQLDHITSFVGEELGSWESEDVEEDFDIYIDEISTGHGYEFSVQQLFAAAQQQGGIARMILRGKPDEVALTRKQENEQELNRVMQENNKRMEEGLRLITQLRTTLGDARYRYIAGKLSHAVPAVQLSMLYDLSRMVLSLSTLDDMQYQQQVDTVAGQYQ